MGILKGVTCFAVKKKGPFFLSPVSYFMYDATMYLFSSFYMYAVDYRLFGQDMPNAYYFAHYHKI